MTHTCLHCRNQFQAKRLDQVYCRQSCRQGAYIKRKGHEPGKHSNSEATNPLQGIDLAGLLGSVPPETLAPLLSILSQNPSLMEKLTDNAQQRAEKPKEESKKPSQNVSDGSRENLNKHAKFMEDSWRSHDENVSSSNLQQRPFDEKDVLSWMVDHNLTIRIGNRGYVRSLFPHWSNKEWQLSLYVNQKMLAVFNYLKKASFNNVISAKSLRACHKQIVEISSGLYAFMLPEDYPFRRFLNLLAGRLAKVIERVKDKTKIRFSVTDDLYRMIIVLEVQLETDL